MRILAIDYGTRRLGLALSDQEEILASPLAVWPHTGLPRLAPRFVELVDEERIEGIVVGLPLHMNGSESEKSGEAREFAHWLGKLVPVPVEMWDERLTTVEAEDVMIAADLTRAQRKRRIDMLAAQRILSSYLEGRRLRQRTEQSSNTDH